MRGAAVLAAGLALTGASGEAGPTRAVGDMFPLPDTLVPDAAIAPDTVVTAKPGFPGSVVLRGKLVVSRMATLDAPVKVAIGGIGREFPAGTVLTAWVKAGPPPALGAGDGPYFCSDLISRRLNHGLYIVVGDIGAKLYEWARFCFVDAKGTGRMDTAFLYGAKDKAPPVAVAVDPAAYHEDRLVQANPKDEVSVSYDRFRSGSRKMDLKIHYITHGEDQIPLQIATFVDGQAVETVTDLRSDPEHHPYPIHWVFLGASLGVESVDEHGVARFRINRNFAQQYVTPVGIFDEPVSAYYLYRGK